VAIVSGKQASRSDQELNTLRARLHAATIVILFGFAIYLVRSYFDNRPLQGFHTLVVVALTGFVGVLSSRVDLSLTHLRCIELGIFGLPVAFFLPYHYFCILQQAEAQDPVGLVAIFQNVSSYWFCLLVIYGLFVPNHWKRAAIVVTPMVLLPIAAGVAAGFANPLVAEHLGFRHLSDTMMVLSIGALCASYGAEVISSLRQEADEARQFGQYRLQEQLGKGGMGEVYKAEHRLLKRPCAIKLIRPEHAGDPHMLARFEREVRTTAKLTHWNTIDIYDYGRTDEGTFYYVMEYLPGKSLRDVIAESSTIPPERAVHLLCQVCDALSEAHAQSFIHRDINPNNIFVTSRGGVYDVAKLLDFGLVKSVASGGGDEANLTMTGTVTGTPKYMAPEQSFSEGEPHVCSDIYSLGAVAYAMLTGYPPFDGANVMAIIMAHARDPVRRPTEINNKIPEELEQVVLKCLEKRPEDRFPTAESLREALQACPLDDSWTQHAAASWWREVEESASTEPDATEPAALPNE
jgi:serine/threonine-protein kinase